jgi:hypothetical protein
MGVALGGAPGSNSNFTINSDDTILVGDLNVNGGEILSSQNTFDFLINNSDVRIGSAAGTGTTVINNSLQVKGNFDIATSAVDLTIVDNSATALDIKEGTNSYLTFATTDSAERIIAHKDFYVTGNLYVDGTETIINTSILSVDDKQIVIGDVVSPTDALADNGGILLQATTPKTITYNSTNNIWDLNIGAQINGFTTIRSSGAFVGLDVSSTSIADISLIDRTNDYGWVASNRGDGNFQLLFENPTSTFAERLTITSAGRVNLGAASNSTNNNGIQLGADIGSLNLYTTRYATDCLQIINTSGSGTNVALQAFGNGNLTLAGELTSNGITQYALPTIVNGGQLGYDDGTKSLRLYSNSSTNVDAKIQFHFNQSGTAGITFDQSGAMSFTGQEVSSVGNNVNKTSSSFDHYEQGTFSPYYGDGITNPSYAFAGGHYIRIGNLVHFWLTISATGTNNTDAISIQGLPYNPAGTDGGSASFSYNTGLVTTGNTMPNVYIYQNGSIAFWETGSGTAWTGNSGTGLSGAQIYLGGNYYVA